MSDRATENEPSLTIEEASELVGDDVAYWLANPFMTPDMLAEKAARWISRAHVLSSAPTTTTITCTGCTREVTVGELCVHSGATCALCCGKYCGGAA